jgi:hypothetical protein
MNPIEIHSSLKSFPLPEFGGYFSNFKKSAFRLELLSRYNVPDETEDYKKFLAGQSEPPDDYLKDWRSVITSAKASGKEFRRVRVVDGSLSNYLKFEIAWAYRGNIVAGEDIRFIIRTEIQPFNTSVPILKDYWLFDDAECFLMDYDYCGTFLGISRVPTEIVQHYVALKGEAEKLSIPSSEAFTSLGV